MAHDKDNHGQSRTPCEIFYNEYEDFLTLRVSVGGPYNKLPHIPSLIRRKGRKAYRNDNVDNVDDSVKPYKS